MNLKYAKRSEATEQITVIQWCKINEGVHPDLKYIFHPPNGGSRNKMEAANLKQQGVKPGVPDLELPVPRRTYMGLHIEMKYDKNTVTKSQDDFLKALKRFGRFVAVCYTAEAAIGIINNYIKLKSGEKMREDGERYPVLGKE